MGIFGELKRFIFGESTKTEIRHDEKGMNVTESTRTQWVKPKVEENTVNDIKDKANTSIFQIGQILYAKNGDQVRILDMTENDFSLAYNGKVYTRSKDSIGRTLFLERPSNWQKVKVEEEKKKREQELAEKERREELLIRKQEEERLKRLQLQEEHRKQILAREQEEKRRLEQQKRLVEQRRLKKLEEEKKQREEKERKEKQLEEKLNKYKYLVEDHSKKKVIIYHEIYSEGYIESFSSDLKYVNIYFQEEGITTFSFPEAMDNYLFLEKPNSLLEYEGLLCNEEYKQEDREERNYFESIVGIVESKLKNADNEDYYAKAAFNDFSDSFDSNAYKARQVTSNELMKWTQIRRQPYFARIDYKGLKRYIGKSSIDNYVLDWRDKECIIYYKPDLYISKENYAVKLIRDFNIVAGKYLGFNDKFNKLMRIDSEQINNLISDEFLLSIVEENRKTNKATDIIQSIQQNQYDIITCDSNNNVLVQGCAGSGKTMILLHRLSYMYFHDNKSQNYEYYAVSPTELLNLENDILAKTLSLNKIRRLSRINFYIDLIGKYKISLSNIYNLSGPLKVNANHYVEEDFIEYIYSDDVFDSIKEDIESIVKRNGAIFEQLTEHEYSQVTEQFKEFEPKDSFDFDLVMIVEEVEKSVAKLSPENVNEYIEHAKNKDSTVIKKKKILKMLYDYWELSGVASKNTDPKSDRKYDINDELFTEQLSYFDGLGSSNKKNKKYLKEHTDLLDRFSDPITFFTEYRRLQKRYIDLNDYVSGKSYDFFNTLVKSYIWMVKEEFSVSQNDIFEFELYIWLIACYQNSGILDDKMYIFIDEYQDYSASEILLLERICDQGVFNLYGDVKQNISIKGITENHLKALEMNNWMRYEINENYRNAYQISTYVNDHFNMSMLPIGLSGNVSEVDLDNLSSSILESIPKTAVIYKERSNLEYLISKGILNEFIEINEGVDSLSNEVINVITVQNAKGLEFNKVIVIIDGMNDNERYVAFTRAMSQLIVIK